MRRKRAYHATGARVLSQGLGRVNHHWRRRIRPGNKVNLADVHIQGSYMNPHAQMSRFCLRKNFTGNFNGIALEPSALVKQKDWKGNRLNVLEILDIC